MSIALRPMSVGELLDRSFFLYRKHFLLFVGIAALPHAVILALQLAGVVIRSKMGAAFLGWTLVWSLASMVCYLAVTAASQGATVMAVSKVHLDRPTSVAESFASIKGRIFYLSLILIGVGIGISVGFVLLIVPGIILALMWALTMPCFCDRRTVSDPDLHRICAVGNTDFDTDWSVHSRPQSGRIPGVESDRISYRQFS
jgi:hypothetical protein